MELDSQLAHSSAWGPARAMEDFLEAADKESVSVCPSHLFRPFLPLIVNYLVLYPHVVMSHGQTTSSIVALWL